MTNPQVKISVEKTRLFGLFRYVTGKVSSRFTWVEARKQGIVELEIKRCEDYLDQLFEKLRNDPNRQHITEFSEDLPEGYLEKVMEENK